MDLQLLIKAPNQNIEDLVITCQMDWTVLKLKKHLSEVYPNHPGIEEQKLIYSGHLLHNHLQLKDVLRHENMKCIHSTVHTIHLVCSGDSFFSYEQNSDINKDLPNETSTPIQYSNNLSNPNEDSLRLTSASTEIPENVLRHRGHSSVPAVNIETQFPQMPVNSFPVYPTDPQMLAQMVAMQQMYAQYLTQYWQSWNVAASSAIPTVFPLNSNLQPQQNNHNNTPAEAVPAQQPVNQRLNIVAEQANEENNEFGNNRDWLDQLFLYCRFLVLLSIVYFYSTPERFMLVILCLVIAFLYREGWFMRRTLAEAVMRHRIQHGIMPDPANNANEQASNQNEGHDGHELEAAMDGEDPPHAQNPDVVNNNQVFSPLAFLVMFFSSLIPEPPPPVNIN